MADYYKVLGVTPSSSTNEIDRAFYKLKSKFTSEDTEDPFFKNFYRRILEAHNVLSNEERRSKYDKNYSSDEIKFDNKDEIKKDSKEPIIEYFKANKKELEVGGKIILSWKTTKADEVILIPFGKVSAIGSKIIYYKDFEQDKVPFSLKAVNNNSKKEISKGLFIRRVINEAKEKPKKAIKEKKNHREAQANELFEMPDVNIDNSSQSNFKKYGVPSVIGVLLIVIILFALGQSGFWESSNQSIAKESLPVIKNEKSHPLIALNWGNIHQEKEMLIQNLRRSSKSDDQRILEFITGIQEIIQGMNESLYKDNNYDKLTSMLYSDGSSVDPDAAQFLETVDKNGFKISHSEGMPYLEENTTFIRSVVETNIHNPLVLQYLDLYIEGIDSPCCEDAGLIISYDELIKRTYNWGEFLLEAQDTSLEDIANRKFGSFLYLVFKGIDNTPAFDYENGLYNSELLGKLEQLVLDYPFSLSAIEFKEYIKLLKAEKFERTNKIEDYVYAITEANFDLSSEDFFVRFRDPDFHAITNEEKIRRLIKSENLRDFANIGSFYAKMINRYYDTNTLANTELNTLYNTAWSNTKYSKSFIHEIINLNGRNLESITNFKYLTSEGDTITQLSSTHYTFNDEGLIKEVYGVDSDYTYREFRESDFNIISNEEKIKRLLLAEDTRDYPKIGSFYSANMKRYWNAEDPSFSEIHNIYINAWEASSYSKNIVLTIETPAFNTYDVKVRFSFYDDKASQMEERENITRYVFNQKGLIEEVYGL